MSNKKKLYRKLVFHHVFQHLEFLSQPRGEGEQVGGGGGGELPYKNDRSANRTLYGFKLVDWYHLGC